MEAGGSRFIQYSTYIPYHITPHHIVDDNILHGHCCEKLKSYNGEDVTVEDRIQDTKTTCYIG